MEWAALLSGAVTAVLAGLALVGTVAAVLVLRDHGRLARHAETRERALEAEIEALQDRIWQVQEQEERYRVLVEAQRDVIVRRDANGTILFANDEFAALMGRSRDGLIGTRIQPRVVESGPVAVLPDGARLVDEAVETPEGLRWFAWLETIIAVRGGGVETLRSGREVTRRVVEERALAEARTRAEAASEAKSRFLATVSHEFRTPLNGILGMADLLLDTSLVPEQTTYVQAIRHSGQALLSLIDEILDFSKIEAGKLDLVAEPFDLHNLVEGVVELLAPRAQGKGIEIAAHVARGTPRRVVGDGDRLRQVLVNLAGNAVKFTEIGGVGIRVERGVAGALTIAVMDTGPGIPPAQIPLLFQDFEQGDGSPARRHGGTGLGLAITRRIVERMQGSIQVDSTPGEGSSFILSLPLPDADGGNPPAEETGDVSGLRFLVLADSPFEVPFLTRRLTDAGASVTVTHDEAEALAKIAVAPHDALLIDCALGDETARAVARAAREAGVPRCIVLVSPFERRDLGPPQEAGFDAFLVKPVRSRSLFERLSEGGPARGRQPAAVEPRLRPVWAVPPRVLLAEDNDINALLALKSLEKLGALVDWVRNGLEAVAAVQDVFDGGRPAYDLVLMDVRMPDLDGLEATRRIRAAEAARGSAPVRIVALTANALAEDEAAAREAGTDGFLAKPFPPRALQDLLEQSAPPLARVS